jgi:hypothetical protein
MASSEPRRKGSEPLADSRRGAPTANLTSAATRHDVPPSDGGDRTNPWALALLIVDFDESHGQVIQHVHPMGAVSVLYDRHFDTPERLNTCTIISTSLVI